MNEQEALIVAKQDPLLAVIQRASSDPNVDVAKMEKLLELAERVHARQAEAEYDRAMNAAQSEMRPIATDSDNPQTRSRYASYGALDRATRPIYSQHGFSLSFGTRSPAPDRVVVTCRVSHRAGHTERVEIDMPADGKGAKGGDVMTKTHATGSAVSYGMRYLLKMIFNLAIGEYDDDGNAAAGRKPAPNAPRTKQEAAKPVQPTKATLEATEEQKQRFLAKLQPVAGGARDYFIAVGQLLPTEELTDLPLRHVPATAKQFDAVMTAIQNEMDRKLDQIPDAEVDEPNEFILEPPDEAWRQMVVPFGKNKGEKFGDLDKKSLWWWVMVWKPETREFKGKVYEPSADDLALYDAIQQVKPEIVARYEFKEPKQ